MYIVWAILVRVCALQRLAISSGGGRSFARLCYWLLASDQPHP